MQYASKTQPADLQAFNRLLKTIYFVLLGSLWAYWFAMEYLASETRPSDAQLIRRILYALAVADVGVVVYWRFSRIARLLSDAHMEFTERLRRLRADYLVCFIVSEAVAVYGFFLRLVGGSREEVAPFFAVAVVLFLLCYPRPPETLGGLGA